MSLDLNFDYRRAKQQINALKAYNELSGSYDEVTKDLDDFYNNLKSDVTQGVNNLKNDTRKFKRDIKNQFQQLLDINDLLGEQGSNSLASLKRIMLQTLKVAKPYLNQIIFDEAINAIGCDQQQSFTGQTFYIKVPSIDLNGILKYDANNPTESFFYEPNPIQLNQIPFSMNRQLYELTQSNLSFSAITGQNYKGLSGQDLFDIKYVDQIPSTGQYGPWFEVTILNRVNNSNKVGEFLLDYFQTIELIDFKNIVPNIMEALTGCFSISANIGVKEIENASKFEIYIQRILGLCFDNDEEINTSGVAKIGELDTIDQSFFELTELDLRRINNKIENIRNGVVEFLQCDNVKFPVNSASIINSLINFRDATDEDEVEEAARQTSVLINNPNWRGLSLDASIEAKIDFNFVNLIVQGLVVTVISPKVLLPIFIILKALGRTIVDAIDGYEQFAKIFQNFLINVVSKFSAVFIEKLFDTIKLQIKRLLQRVIRNIFREKKNKIYNIILRLVQLLLVVGQLISDWRKCKSVIDEILSLLRFITVGVGGNIPLPLLFASELLDGYSESRAFVGAIDEFQKMGLPTGPQQDGSPNYNLLSLFGLLKAQAEEDANSNKLAVAIPPLTITPAGVSVPARASGKKL